MHALGSVMFPTQRFETLGEPRLIQGFINFFGPHIVLSYSEIWIQISYLCLMELLSLVMLV